MPLNAPNRAADLNRRNLLRGFGASLALPWMESLRPVASAAALGAVDGGPPLRAAWVFVPNGIHMPNWTPTAEGADFDLPPTLEPLADQRDKLLVLSGLAHDKGRANGDGPGDHARCASVYLTASQPYKTSGANIRVGVSVDQVAAARVGLQTRFPSLELGVESGRNAGNCDSGYSCAYSSNISWKTPTTPMAKEVNPREVFERLFGGDDAGDHAVNREQRNKRSKSILDFVLADAKRLEPELAGSDRNKLDEYLTSVRDVERRISQFEADATPFEPNLDRPEGVPEEYEDHVRLMYELLAISFQADRTRVATFMMANAGSNRAYRNIGVSDGHHDLSHHRNDEEKLAKIAEINRYHASLFGEFLAKLRAIPEGDGTLLDHVMIMYGSGLGDGNRHNHDDLPILLAGGAGGTMAMGRHVNYREETPVANLYLSMLDRLGAGPARFGDSTGRVDGLTG